MMMFHIAVGIMLIALVAGMLLYIKAKKNDSSLWEVHRDLGCCISALSFSLYCILRY